MDLPQNDLHISGAESAKAALLAHARAHDSRRESRAKPVRNMLIAAGAAAVLTRLVLGGARRARGGKLMGLMLAARMAMKYGPVLVQGFHQAKRAYDDSQAKRRPSPVRVRARLVDRAESLPRA
jgi:hypothetical protein